MRPDRLRMIRDQAEKHRVAGDRFAAPASDVLALLDHLDDVGTALVALSEAVVAQVGRNHCSPQVLDAIKRGTTVMHGERSGYEQAKLEADIGNQQAWDRFYRSEREVKALQRLCAEVTEELFQGQRFQSWDPSGWRYRLFTAAAGLSLVADSDEGDAT